MVDGVPIAITKEEAAKLLMHTKKVQASWEQRALQQQSEYQISYNDIQKILKGKVGSVNDVKRLVVVDGEMKDGAFKVKYETLQNLAEVKTSSLFFAA